MKWTESMSTVSVVLTATAHTASSAKRWASNLVILAFVMFLLLLLSGAMYAAPDVAVASIQRPAAKCER